MSIHISLSYQKKKEDYNKEEVVGVCLFYYFNKKKIKISTGVKSYSNSLFISSTIITPGILIVVPIWAIKLPSTFPLL